MSFRNTKEYIAHKTMFLFCVFVIVLAMAMCFGLMYRSLPILSNSNISELLFSTVWNPPQNKFGLANFVIGTLWVTVIAMLIAVPFGILTSLYISEYAPQKIRNIIIPMLDLLAGISPVIYGVWGVVAIVPLIRDYAMPYLSERFPFFPFASDNYTGFCVISGSIVLAIMVLPIIISIIVEILKTIPFEMREASLSLGATKWQTVKHTLLRKAFPGIIAAVILGLSRAFGETMAVLMVCGCSLHGLTKSIFDPAYPLPALIANTYGEMMSIPLYDSAIMLSALLLLLVTSLFNIIGWGILIKFEKRGL